MFTPVLLTLLDETQTSLKLRALVIFDDFWTRCPDGLMESTGLASVFEDAIFPAVMYLPNLTPLDESLQILGAAYPALLALGNIKSTAPKTHKDAPLRTPPFTEMQAKLLDKIIREGLIIGYHHAREYTQLVALFCNELRRVVLGMGILAVKHLKVRRRHHPLPPP
jgi:hypothetical protein